MVTVNWRRTGRKSPQALAALSELQEERKRIPGELKELQQQREEHQKRLESLPRESERDELPQRGRASAD